MSKVIFLMGPTASGKTDLSIELSKKLPLTIISVDSVLVYKGLDIGTAKPDLKIRELVPHKLIDILDPTETYSVADFRKNALFEISNSIKKNRIPLLVGGSMFYFRSLLKWKKSFPKGNLFIRNKILKFVQKKGWKNIYNYLKKIDPIYLEKIHINDSYRLLRALEIFLITGKGITDLNKNKKEKFPYKVYQFAIYPNDFNIIKRNIYARFFKMLDLGFENEVRELYHRNDLNDRLSSIRSVGYYQMWSYISGKISYIEMISKTLSATYQLVKHQMNWLKRWKEIYKLDINDLENSVKYILKLIEK